MRKALLLRRRKGLFRADKSTAPSLSLSLSQQYRKRERERKRGREKESERLNHCLLCKNVLYGIAKAEKKD
jgi:hypothetical protein